MGQEHFHAMLLVICADLVTMISSVRNISEIEAISVLYTSGLYDALEQEETKVWQYSTPMLYSLLEQEWTTGTIIYPDV